jgi:NADPH:quinone reductase-like Zn-dependent oxidoreductase
MRAYQLMGGGFDGLQLVDRITGEPGPGELEVRVEATSLNYRDLMMAKRSAGVIPLSDGAGVVTRVGEGVTGIAEGDRVAGTFFSNWVDGRAFAAMHGAALGCWRSR